MKRSDGQDTIYPPCPQQALQMDAIAQAMLNNRPSPVPASMGLRDMQIIQAIYKAMETGKRVTLKK